MPVQAHGRVLTQLVVTMIVAEWTVPRGGPPPGGPPGSNALATNANEDSAKIKATSNPTIVKCRVMGNVGKLFYINWLLY